jgi:hypothetical protein
MKAMIVTVTMVLTTILGLAREVSAQSVVDPFTTAQASGFSNAPWVTLQGTLFKQRQLQRFNSATASVPLGTAAWTVGTSTSATQTSNGTAHLNYRQDDISSTIDLSGIKSMSFSVAVTGTVTLDWYLENVNGESYSKAQTVLTAGNSIQTFDLSTAVMDQGFDLKVVTGMTVKFTAVQSGESATVTNFTFTPLPTDVPLDTFLAAQNSSGNGFGAAWASPSGTLFTQRQVARFNSAGTGTASIGGGFWTAILPRATSGSPSSSVLSYRQNRSYSPIDLRSITTMKFDISVISGSVSGYWYLMDQNGFIAEVPDGFVRSIGTSTVTLDLRTAAIDEGFDLSKVVEMRVWISATSANSSFSVKNLTYR